MANLKSEGKAIEVTIIKFGLENEINYEVRPLINGNPVLNDSILWDDKKRTQRKEGAIAIEDYGRERLIQLLKTILETEEPGYFQPLEPGFIFAIYPHFFYPFDKKDFDNLFQFWRARETARRNGGPVPAGEDEWTVILSIDPIKYIGMDASGVDGPSMIMVVERNDVEQFLKDLEKEYDAAYGEWEKKKNRTTTD